MNTVNKTQSSKYTLIIIAVWVTCMTYLAALNILTGDYFWKHASLAFVVAGHQLGAGGRPTIAVKVMAVLVLVLLFLYAWVDGWRIPSPSAPVFLLFGIGTVAGLLSGYRQRLKKANR